MGDYKQAVLAIFLCVASYFGASRDAGSNPAAVEVASWLANFITISQGAVEAPKLFNKFNSYLVSKNFEHETFSNIAQTLNPDARLLASNIESSGEKGLLLDVWVYEKSSPDGETTYVLSAVLPNGFGTSPGDAASKALMGEDNIYSNGLLNATVAKQKLPEEGYVLSELSFGIWIERKANGHLFAQTVPDLKKYTAEAALSWKLHKSFLLQGRTKAGLDQLASVNIVYDKISNQFEGRARKKNVIGELNALKGAQQIAAKKMAEAMAMRQSAYDRYDKYKGYSEVAGVLGLAAGATQGWNDLATKADAKKAYYDAAVQSVSVDLQNRRIDLNTLFIQKLDVKQEALPSPQVTIPKPD